MRTLPLSPLLLAAPAALLPLSLSLHAPATDARSETDIVFAPAEGVSLQRSFVARLEMSLEDFTASVDGEDLVSPEDLDFTLTSVETIVVTDDLDSVDDGRPTEFVRTFDELLQEATFETSEGETESLSISDLEGRALRFEWDEDGEYYFIDSADEDEASPDEDVLEWLEEDMDLRAVLPVDEDGDPIAVSEGDSWPVDELVYLPLMWPGGLLGFHDEGEEVSADSRDMNQQTIENLEGEGEATFEGIEERDGVRVAVIRVELSVETEAESGGDADDELEDGTPVVRLEIQRELTGEVLWDIENGHLHYAEFEAEIQLSKTRERTIVLTNGEDEQEFEYAETEEYEGEIHYVVEIERF